MLHVRCVMLCCAVCVSSSQEKLNVWTVEICIFYQQTESLLCRKNIPNVPSLERPKKNSVCWAFFHIPHISLYLYIFLFLIHNGSSITTPCSWNSFVYETTSIILSRFFWELRLNFLFCFYWYRREIIE